MDCCDRLQKVVDYVESHLKEEIDTNNIIKQSYYSTTHFYRLFGAMVGVSLNDYIRKRRLANAVIELCTNKNRLIDIAFEYGFHSQEVFTRAFLREFGTTPGRYRLEQRRTVLYEKVNIRHRLTINSLQELLIHPEVLLDKDFIVIGIGRIVSPGSNSIRNLWEEFSRRCHEIKAAISENRLGLCEYAPEITDEDHFNYLACMEVGDMKNIPSGMIGKRILPSKYVRITHKGSMDELKNTYNAFYGIWFPCSGLELAEQDTIEVYHYDSNDLDIYIPVK